MTIPATPRRSPVYVGNGVATSYAFGFKVTDPATLVVTVADENDLNAAELTYLTDYTVTLNVDQTADPGGEISYAGLPVGHRLVITSATDSSQPTSISNLGAFHAHVLEGALDRLAIQHQQQQEQIDRAIKVGVTSEQDPSEFLQDSLDTAANSASQAAASALSASYSAAAAATFDPDLFVKLDGTSGTQQVVADPLFETATPNGNTVVGLAPEGSGSASSLRAYGKSDTANSPYGFFYCHDTNGVIFGANKTGSASAPKISIQTNATTQLEIGTDGIAKWTQQQQGPNGTVSAPTYSFTDDTDTGMYYGSGALRFAVDSSNNLAIEPGNVRAYKPLVSESASGGQFCSHRPGVAAHALLTHSDATFRLAVSDADGAPVINLTGWSGSAYYPIADGTITLGASSNRWAVVYAADGTINTSDAREKTAVRPLTDAEIAAAKALSKEIGVYRWLESVEKKGPAAREHIGLTVQRAIEIMESFGLDPMRYGFICYDAWEATDERPAGDRYSFRYDELNLFLARGFEARLAALEAR